MPFVTSQKADFSFFFWSAHQKKKRKSRTFSVYWQERRILLVEKKKKTSVKWYFFFYLYDPNNLTLIGDQSQTASVTAQCMSNNPAGVLVLLLRWTAYQEVAAAAAPEVSEGWDALQDFKPDEKYFWGDEISNSLSESRVNKKRQVELRAAAAQPSHRTRCLLLPPICVVALERRCLFFAPLANVEMSLWSRLEWEPEA